MQSRATRSSAARAHLLSALQPPAESHHLWLIPFDLQTHPSLGSETFYHWAKVTERVRDSAATTAPESKPLSSVYLPSSPRERGAECLMGQARVFPPTPAGQPGPWAPARRYLEQCGCHVEDDEDEGEGGVPSLHTADGVQEDQVSGNHEQEEDPG